MTDFEKKWYELFMKNMVTLESLQKLVGANKLNKSNIDKWKAERLEKFGH